MKKIEMATIFKMEQKELKAYLYERLIESHGEENVINASGYLYAKGTHPVLLVAHMDTVHKTPPSQLFYSEDGRMAMAKEGIGGDDRCGVIIILDILERLKCSVVFCEDEEVGCIGAKKFCSDNLDLDVNYAVEFDRRGSNDYVFYKDYNEKFSEFIEKFGFEKASGSMSDISKIAPAYKIEAVNLSSGYYNAHTAHEYVCFEEMADITERATAMIAEPTGKWDYVEEKPVVYSYPKYTERDWSQYYAPQTFLSPAFYSIFHNGKAVKFDRAWMKSSGKVVVDKYAGKPLKGDVVVCDRATGMQVDYNDICLWY